MLNTPFSPWPSFTSEEAEAVSRVLLSNKVNYWTGSECRDFEAEFAQWVNVPYAVSLANGTLALEAALRAAGVRPGDEVVVTPRSFFASASCVVAVGAVPVFADVDRNTQGLTAESIARALTPRTRGVICVHLGGMPCDMEPIMELARVHGLKVIEDCAQAHGASYRGLAVGTIGDVGAWSFCQDKIMTTGGEGGMITTKDRSAWLHAWSFKDHGKGWSAVYERTHPPGFRWLHESFGSNWRMLEMQAVLGRIQLRRMPAWAAARARNSARLADVARRHPVVRVPETPADCVHANYRFYAFVEASALAAGWSRDRIVEAITSRSVPCYHGSCSEIYLEKAFEGTGMRPAQRLPVARELGETSLMMLVHPTLTEDEMDNAALVLDEVLRAATR